MATTWDETASLSLNLTLLLESSLQDIVSSERGPLIERHIQRARAHWLRLALTMLVVVLSAVYARAQDNYEIQVYGYELVEPGHTMVELHSNFTIDGSKETVDGVYPTNHAEHETIEITHGFSDWFECGFYIFTSITAGQGWQWVGDHIRPRVAVPKKWHWPVGVSISNELGYQRRQYSPDTWTWEIRPIVDQKVGRWYWSLNPTLDRSFHGENVHQGVVFSPNAKFSYRLDTAKLPPVSNTTAR